MGPRTLYGPAHFAWDCALCSPCNLWPMHWHLDPCNSRPVQFATLANQDQYNQKPIPFCNLSLTSELHYISIMPKFCQLSKLPSSLQLRHNERDGISYHWRFDCLFNHLFRLRSKHIWKLCLTGLCEGNSPVNSLHKGPLTQKIFSFDDVVMIPTGCWHRGIWKRCQL